jgi:hypothetical protein
MAMGNGARFSNLRTDHYARQRFCCRRSQARLFPLIGVVVDLCGPASGPQFIKADNIGVLAVSKTSSLTPLISICFSRASRCAAR